MRSNDDLTPWSGLHSGNVIRAESNSDFDVYWYMTKDSFPSIIFKLREEFVAEDMSFRDIDFIAAEMADYHYFGIVLKNLSYVDIFHSLCLDILSLVYKAESEYDLCALIQKRLRLWQAILASSDGGMLKTQQMGLVSELLAIRYMHERGISIQQAVSAWNGPDRDKQDFLLCGKAVEVKSHITSKGNIVRISNEHQLDDTNKRLSLFVYSLTQCAYDYDSKVCDTLESIPKLVRIILSYLDPSDVETRALFESKLIDYGYIQQVKPSKFYGFLVDSFSMYKVVDGFPRVDPCTLVQGISNVSYDIDLSKCRDYLETEFRSE